MVRMVWASPPKSGVQEPSIGEGHSALLDENPSKLDWWGTVVTVYDHGRGIALTMCTQL